MVKMMLEQFDGTNIRFDVVGNVGVESTINIEIDNEVDNRMDLDANNSVAGYDEVRFAVGLQVG